MFINPWNIFPNDFQVLHISKYEKLLKSYQATLRAISVQQGKKASEKTTGVGSPLKNFRGKYENIEVIKRA